MKKLIAIVGFIGFVALLGAAYAQDESITITTYYPSPYGSYRELTTTSNTYLATTEGNVGIGTINPGAKLEVAGQVKITGGGPGVGRVLTSDANGLASWGTAPAGTGISYTYYCFSNNTYGNPVCPASVTIGTQGPCDAGFTVRKALGLWGYCWLLGCNGCSFLRPPGGSCGTNSGTLGPVGQAYVCGR